MKKFIAVMMSAVFICLSAGAAGAVERVLSPQIIYIDDVRADVGSFMADDSNYLMLRDVGRALDIRVEWDDASRTVVIDTARPYGGDAIAYAAPFAGGGAEPSMHTVYLDGERVDFNAYLINGVNYVKLRDIGRALDIRADWDDATRTVVIDTTRAYAAGRSFGGPDIAAREPVGDEYFYDAAYVGNSLIEGLELYSGLAGDFFAVTSFTVFGVGQSSSIRLKNGSYGTIYQAIAQRDYKKIYILFGINEIGYEAGRFRDAYADMLDAVIALKPDAIVYVMSLTPVSASKSASSTVYNMTRVREYNSVLYALAEEKGCYYVDLIEALSDGAGYLSENATWDGVHLTTAHYKVWADYLRTRYIVFE